MSLIFGSKTDKGLVRANNEDNLMVDEKTGIFAVADGMGGYAGGEIASRIMVETISRGMAEYEKINRDKIKRFLLDIVFKAHEEIGKESKANAELRDMGTTVVLGAYLKNKLICVNVGDSRAYLIRNEKIEQISEDHTILNAMVKANKVINETQQRKLKHVLSQAVGNADLLTPSINEVILKNDDFVIFCSDGLTDMIAENEIKKIVLDAGSDLSLACNLLVQTANTNGGKDNITIILCRETE